MPMSFHGRNGAANYNNNNMLAYKAPVCQKTSEAPADRYSQCWECLKATPNNISFQSSFKNSERCAIMTHNGSKHALWRNEVLLGSTRWRQHFGVQISQKPSKMAVYRHVLASSNGLKTNDVKEDWRHLRRSVARSPSLVERRILLIILKKLHTVYPMLYKTTLKNSKK